VPPSARRGAGEEEEEGEEDDDSVEDLAEDAEAPWRKALFERAVAVAAWKDARRHKRVPKPVYGVETVEMPAVGVVWPEDGIIYVGNVVDIDSGGDLFRVHYPHTLSAADEWVHRSSTRFVGFVCKDKTLTYSLHDAINTFIAAAKEAPS
jgi:hypothetical protein